MLRLKQAIRSLIELTSQTAPPTACCAANGVISILMDERASSRLQADTADGRGLKRLVLAFQRKVLPIIYVAVCMPHSSDDHQMPC